MTAHQNNQFKVINKIASEISNNSLSFSTVSAVEDFRTDDRICLTGIHFPHVNLINKIQNDVIKPLRLIEPDFFYYPNESLHMTIKNVRVIHDPPNFSDDDIFKSKEVFSKIVPKCKKFYVYFYKLLLFPNNLSLIGTTDEELDNIVISLDEGLRLNGVPDDKVYVNSKYFFCNMTLARFKALPNQTYKDKVTILSDKLKLEPYRVDSVTLLSCNAALFKKRIHGTWYLR